MKHYLIQPTHKKSVIEIELFDHPAHSHLLGIETGWRWGAFMIDVPETPEEIQQYLSQRNYDTLESFLEERGSSSLEETLLPSENDERINLSEDYEYDFLYTDDGCWCNFEIQSDSLDEDQKQQLVEELEELYEEEAYQGLEENGWQSLGTDYVIDCPVSVTPCDNDGNPLGE